MSVTQVAIIGGGLGGLTTALRLAREGVEVTLIEKKAYPFHKVCGEYVSNETLPYLRRLGVDPFELGAVPISQLTVSAKSGRRLDAALPLGGFGISRYRLDAHLAERCRAAGVQLLTSERVESVQQSGAGFELTLQSGTTLTAQWALGSWGKRELLDQRLSRPFLTQRTGYVGVKYHIATDFAADRIALHNFSGGYCGLSRIEEGRYCLCYLARRDDLRRAGSVQALEANVVRQNKFLDTVWAESDFLYDKPEVINEISFAPKEQVVQGVWLVGDAAGLITPLCGNGMAMAIRGGRLAADLLLEQGGLKAKTSPSRTERTALEHFYSSKWRQLFGTRLWAGRRLQALMGRSAPTEFAVGLLVASPALLQRVVRLTHGEPFA
jgi:flavin-dependent dehydrogenase